MAEELLVDRRIPERRAADGVAPNLLKLRVVHGLQLEQEPIGDLLIQRVAELDDDVVDLLREFRPNEQAGDEVMEFLELVMLAKADQRMPVYGVEDDPRGFNVIEYGDPLSVMSGRTFFRSRQDCRRST
jgi:hypothetical protein